MPLYQVDSASAFEPKHLHYNFCIRGALNNCECRAYYEFSIESMSVMVAKMKFPQEYSLIPSSTNSFQEPRNAYSRYPRTIILLYAVIQLLVLGLVSVAAFTFGRHSVSLIECGKRLSTWCEFRNLASITSKIVDRNSSSRFGSS